MLPRAIPPFDLKQLCYFLAAVEHGSIAAAASALGLAASSLSESIARLEKQLGTSLALRSSSGLTLTEAGEVLCTRAPALLEMAHGLAAAVAGAGESSGTLSLALPPGLSTVIGIPLAETVDRELGDVRMVLSEGLSGDILSWVGSGHVDIGFVYEMPDTAAFEARLLFREELFLIAAEDFLPEAVADPEHPVIELQALAGLPLVVPTERHNARRIIDRIARENAIDLTIVSEIDSHSRILEMVVRASAYSLLPRATVLSQIQQGAVIPVRIAGGMFRRSCYVLRRRKRVVSAASLAVEARAVAIMREMNVRFGLDLDFEPPRG